MFGFFSKNPSIYVKKAIFGEILPFYTYYTAKFPSFPVFEKNRLFPIKYTTIFFSKKTYSRYVFKNFDYFIRILHQSCCDLEMKNVQNQNLV